VKSIDLATQIRERLSILLDIDPAGIGDEAELADLGVDSMMRLELIALVEQRLGYELPEQDLSRLTTISQIVRYVDLLQSAA
jgi:acyl carrier protein